MNNLAISPIHSPFVRSRFSWLSYCLLASFCFLQIAPGSLVPFLHQEMHLSYTVDSLHISSLAVGTIVAGLLGDRIPRWLGLRMAMWVGTIGMVLGGTFLMFSHHPFVSIVSIFCIGLFGCTMSNTVQSTLSDHYGEQRTIAITEANTVACLGAGLAPIFLGIMLSTWLGWRGLLLVPIIMVGVLGLVFHNVQLPVKPQVPVQKVSTRKRAAFSRSFWLFWIVMILVIAFEWGTFSWGSGFLINVVGIDVRTASVLMSLFFFAEMLGRFLGSISSRRFSAQQMLTVALCVGGPGFLLFWLGPTTQIHILGLFIAGLGIGNLFPLTFTIVLSQAPDQAGSAAARCSLGGGIASFCAPLILGRAADMVGLQNAYGFVLVLFVLACAMTIFARYSTRRQQSKLAAVNNLEREIERFLQEQSAPLDEPILEVGQVR